MDYLVSQLALYLGAVGLLGLALGWWLGAHRAGSTAARRAAELEERLETSEAESEQRALDSLRLADRLSELDLELLQAGERADRAAAEATDLRGQLAEERQRVASFEPLLGKRDRRIEELRGELTERRRQVADLEAEIERLLAAGESGERRRSEEQQERRKMASDLAAALARVAQLETELAGSSSAAAGHQRLARQSEQLQSELLRLRPIEARHRETRARVSDLERDLEQSAERLRAAVGERTKLSAELEAAQRRTAQLEREKEESARAAAAIRRDLEAAQAEDEARSAARAELAAEVESLRAELRTATAQLGELDRKASSAEARAQAAERERERVKSELEALLTAPLVDVDRMATVKRIAIEIAPDDVPEPSTGRPELLEAPRGAADDLRRIRGIGEAIESSLNEAGIFHYRQIAAWSESDLEWVAAHLGTFPERIENDRWREQAAALDRPNESSEA